MAFSLKNKIWVGRKHSPETIAKMRSVKKTDEQKRKIGDSLRGTKRPGAGKNLEKFHVKGAGHPAWKGGLTPLNKLIRESVEYKLWRKSVFERDGYACIWGGKEHGNKLHADHIKPFALFPELRFAIDNGRTLCEECHRSTETWGRNNK